MESLARVALAQRRLQSVLSSHTVANARTLEQKIADSGPADQRIDPHVLTIARGLLEARDIIERFPDRPVPWFYLTGTDPDFLASRLAEQEVIHDELMKQQFCTRCGQTLEIAIFKALKNQNIPFLGNFPDLDSHDDSAAYSKEDPPSSLCGLTIPLGKKLDFLLIDPASGAVGVEAKNIRDWIYPDSAAIRELIFKCCYLNAAPVMIARRIAYVTFSVLNPCGLIFHQNYNQLFPTADAMLAEKARHKKLLGYHDIRVGNEPDKRLSMFLHTNLQKVLPVARDKFEIFKDLLTKYSTGEIRYDAFAAIAAKRARELGLR
jgi:hypothetical protein